MSLNEIVKKIATESGLSEKELLDRITKKQEELGGLITQEGAAHIIANEVGVNLFEGISKKPELKIENIIPGMNSVDVVGRVLRVYETREFDKSDGSKGRVCSIILGDDTGSIRTVFWGKDVEMINEGRIEEGALLRIREGYTKENMNGEPELHVGMRTRVIPNPKDIKDEEIPKPEDRKKKIAELKDGMSSVDVVCKILRIYEPREFERDEGKKGRVVNLVVGDETGRARLVLWDEDVSLVERKIVKEGDVVKVNKGYVKARFKEPEINVGKYSKVVLNPSEKIGDMPELEPSTISRKEMKDLGSGERAEIRGALVEIFENLKIFDREDGKGMVANAIIDDGTASMRAAFYDKMAEALLNVPMQKALDGDVSSEVAERIKNITGKEIVATIRVKHSDFSGMDELIVEDIDLNPDPREEAEDLLREIKLIEPKEE